MILHLTEKYLYDTSSAVAVVADAVASEAVDVGSVGDGDETEAALEAAIHEAAALAVDADPQSRYQYGHRKVMTGGRCYWTTIS